MTKGETLHTHRPLCISSMLYGQSYRVVNNHNNMLKLTENPTLGDRADKPIPIRFRASVAMQVRAALFWDIT